MYNLTMIRQLGRSKNGEHFDLTNIRMIEDQVYVPFEYLITKELHLYEDKKQSDKAIELVPGFGKEYDIIEITTIDGKKIVININLEKSFVLK